MEAKIFILALLAFIWKADSQLRDGKIFKKPLKPPFPSSGLPAARASTSKFLSSSSISSDLPLSSSLSSSPVFPLENTSTSTTPSCKTNSLPATSISSGLQQKPIFSKFKSKPIASETSKFTTGLSSRRNETRLRPPNKFNPLDTKVENKTSCSLKSSNRPYSSDAGAKGSLDKSKSNPTLEQKSKPCFSNANSKFYKTQPSFQRPLSGNKSTSILKDNSTSVNDTFRSSEGTSACSSSSSSESRTSLTLKTSPKKFTTIADFPIKSPPSSMIESLPLKPLSTFNESHNFPKFKEVTRPITPMTRSSILPSKPFSFCQTISKNNPNQLDGSKSILPTLETTKVPIQPYLTLQPSSSNRIPPFSATEPQESDFLPYSIALNQPVYPPNYQTSNYNALSTQNSIPALMIENSVAKTLADSLKLMILDDVLESALERQCSSNIVSETESLQSQSESSATSEADSSKTATNKNSYTSFTSNSLSKDNFRSNIDFRPKFWEANNNLFSTMKPTVPEIEIATRGEPNVPFTNIKPTWSRNGIPNSLPTHANVQNVFNSFQNPTNTFEGLSNLISVSNVVPESVSSFVELPVSPFPTYETSNIAVTGLTAENVEIQKEPMRLLNSAYLNGLASNPINMVPPVYQQPQPLTSQSAPLFQFPQVGPSFSDYNSPDCSYSFPGAVDSSVSATASATGSSSTPISTSTVSTAETSCSIAGFGQIPTSFYPNFSNFPNVMYPSYFYPNEPVLNSPTQFSESIAGASSLVSPDLDQTSAAAALGILSASSVKGSSIFSSLYTHVDVDSSSSVNLAGANGLLTPNTVLGQNSVNLYSPNLLTSVVTASPTQFSESQVEACLIPSALEQVNSVISTGVTSIGLTPGLDSPSQSSLSIAEANSLTTTKATLEKTTANSNSLNIFNSPNPLISITPLASVDLSPLSQSSLLVAPVALSSETLDTDAISSSSSIGSSAVVSFNTAPVNQILSVSAPIIELPNLANPIETSVSITETSTSISNIGKTEPIVPIPTSVVAADSIVSFEAMKPVSVVETVATALPNLSISTSSTASTNSVSPSVTEIILPSQTLSFPSSAFSYTTPEMLMLPPITMPIPSPFPQDLYNLEISPVILEIEIPSTMESSIILSPFEIESTSPLIYELYLPSSLTTQFLCPIE